MSDTPHRPTRRSVATAALRIGWLACIAAILAIPGTITLLAGMSYATAGLATLFTTMCVALAAFLVNYR
ncbi:hypothetical protein [Rhodococcus sp. ACT016]|uniref:hypothetical protein n=1 Tax=Rhodococcus sp. ACT016 TaxID=3134808 RepID=UPI003D2B9E51